MKLKVLAAASLSLLAITAAGCSAAPAPESSAPPAEPGELVVYTSRKEDFVAPLLEKFTADTGIEVEALYADDAVVNRLKEEAGSPQADVIIGNDAGALEYLRLQEVLAPVGDIEGIDSIDSAYRAADGSWFGLSARTRGLIYNKGLIGEADVPTTIWDLTDPKYKGMFAITRGGNGSMIAHISALRAEWGDERTEEWIRKAKDNAGAITSGHGDIRKAVGAGEFAFGLVNNYYYHQQLREPTDNNVGFIYLDQAAGEMGAVVNAAGVGFVADGPNLESARAFAAWVLLPENQREFSNASLEVPLNPEIEAPEGTAAIDSYRVHGLPLSRLGEVWEDTRSLIERAGLDLELK
ncbi:MAG: extracellular solute-binding protein [Coriobacteriia bacterium]